MLYIMILVFAQVFAHFEILWLLCELTIEIIQYIEGNIEKQLGNPLKRPDDNLTRNICQDYILRQE